MSQNTSNQPGAATASGMPNSVNAATDSHGGGSSSESAAAGFAAQAKQKASETVDQGLATAKSEAEHVRQMAEGKVSELTGQAKQVGRRMVDEKKQAITGELGLLTNALSSASQKLHAENNDAIAQYADMAIDRVERFRTQLEGKDVEDLIDDFQSFTRRQPAIVFGGLFVAGLVAMRFLKASSHERTEREMARQASAGSGRGRTLTPQQAAAVGGPESVPRSMYNQKS